MARKNTSTKEKSPFKVGKVEPVSLTPDQFITEFDTAMVALKKLEMQQRGKRVVELKVNHSDPIQLVLAGDLHLGSFATNKEMCDNLKQYLLDTPNAVLVLLGDEIEGFKAKYATTNVATTMPGLQTQLDYFYYEFFKPLADAGKIGGVVSGYWGHNGWAHDDTTINIWQVMIRHNEDIPLIANGGLLKVRFKNGQTSETQVHHNPPGSSQIDPVHGLRKTAQTRNPSNRPDNFAAGHLHRAMVSSEFQPGADKVTNYVQAGTPKASVPGDNTDVFGEKLGLSHTDPWVQGLVLQPKKGRPGRKGSRPEVQYPFISADQGALVYGALEILNKTEKSGSTADIMGQIYEQFPGPNVSYQSRRSTVSSSPADMLEISKKQLRTKDEQDKITGADIKPLYETVTYDIQTMLPITINPIGNARLGSWHEANQNTPVERFNEQVAADPYGFAIYLRNVLDKDVAKDPQRLDILQRYINMVAAMDGRALGVMLDTSLGNKSWLKRLGDQYSDRPIAAGSYLASQTNAKLIHHLSTVNVAVGPQYGYANKPVYPMQTADRLLRHGSYTSTKGIKRLYDLHTSDRPAVMMGGHMPVSGVSQFYDRTNNFTDTPITLSPGWWSKFVDTTGTRSKGGRPGQGVILVPGREQSEAMMIPTSSADQTEYLSQAMTLLVGAGLLGIANKL